MYEIAWSYCSRLFAKHHLKIRYSQFLVNFMSQKILVNAHLVMISQAVKVKTSNCVVFIMTHCPFRTIYVTGPGKTDQVGTKSKIRFIS